MGKEKNFEIFLTSNNVTELSWLDFIIYVSKLNGIFRKWKIYIKIENNNVRYFITTKKEMPTTLSNLNDFLIQKIDEVEKYSNFNLIKSLYLVTSREKSIVDVYDRNESKHSRKLEFTEINILPISRNNFLYSSIGYFKKKKRIICKKFLFNIPNQFLSIDFSKHTRFLYRKDIKRYLNIEKTVKIFESDNKNGILKIDAFPYLQNEYFLNLSKYDFDKHSLILGGSGTGKSKLISLLVQKIYNNPEYKMKYKIVIIDPHSSIENDIGGLEETKVIDFETDETSIDLFMNSKENIISESEVVLSIFKNLMDKQYNSKLERVLRHCIYLLISIERLSLNNLRKLIIENDFRNMILKKYKLTLPDQIIDFFQKDFNELKNKSHQEAISPIISFIDELMIFPVFNKNKNVQNIEDVIKNNFLTIVSINESIIGEKTTKTLAGLVMGQIFNLMQKNTIDEHIIFIVDEIPIVQNSIIKRFLSESRKYNLSIMLAGQYFNQINEDIQKSIFANVINYYTFRVSREDAVILSRNMQMELAVHDSFFGKTKMLTELANRECVLRISSMGKVLPAFKAKTLDVKLKPRKKEKLNKKIEYEESKRKKENNKKFLVNDNVDLKKIMLSQSTGRRKIIHE